MKKVAIDIGHARMTGAVGKFYEEHYLCAKMAPILKASLEERGVAADIIDFPENTNADDLRLTAQAINAGGYDASISLHCDASTNADACGAHVCYVSQAGGLLASEIALRLCGHMPGRANKTVRRTDLYILNNTKCPAVLVETGFITNAEDARRLVNEPEPLMLSVALGIKAWLDYQDDNVF